MLEIVLEIAICMNLIATAVKIVEIVAFSV